MSKRTVSVQVEREGKWWMIRVPELDILTQARRLADVERNALEAISATLDVALEDLAVTVEVRTPTTAVSQRVDRVRAERARAAQIERDALNDAAALAVELAEQGIPLRDIGAALGLSFQRAQQLVTSVRR